MRSFSSPEMLTILHALLEHLLVRLLSKLKMTHNQEFLHLHDPLLDRAKFLVGNDDLPGDLIG